MVLDTGATAHLMKTTINHLLAKAQASNMSVRGAFGADRKPADRHGIAKMYILNTLEPRRHGTSIEPRVDTLPGLNDELFSMSEYYEDMECDIHLVHDGFSGIRGTDPHTGQRIEIPAWYHRPWQGRGWGSWRGSGAASERGSAGQPTGQQAGQEAS